jgi:hypothetical protein
MIVSRQASITGSTFYLGATAAIERLRFGQPLVLVREPTNKYDKNAIAVHLGKTVDDKLVAHHKIGHISATLAKELAPIMDAGTQIKACRARTALVGVMLLQWDDGQ